MMELSAPHSFYICTAEECRQMDQRTIEQFGIDGFTLMEVAGSSTAKYLQNLLPEQSNGLYLCGKGNNAGDALVVARYLIQYGHSATIVFLSGSDDLSPDASKNLNLIQQIIDNDPSAAPVTFLKNWTDFNTDPSFGFIVDGMLGTGLSSDLRGSYVSATEWANDSNIPTYAIDIPTGLHADTGRIMGTAIRAEKTFTFGARKLGFYLEEGYSCTGDVIYCDLPFPNYLKSSNTFLLDSFWIKEPNRSLARHKYEAGVLYVVAGSQGLTGAAIMAAKSAWAEGVGAVILVCPRGIVSVFENNLPQIIKKPVGNSDDISFKKEHLDEVLKIINDKNGPVLFGPGIGREQSTLNFATDFFDRYNGQLLIDADALWCLAQKNDWQKPDGATWILTPHPGELSKLFKQSFDGEYERFESVRTTSFQKKIILVSKGFPSIIGTQQKTCYITNYDTRIFSRAGFGDVLAGKIGAYWALGHAEVFSCSLGLLNGYKKITLQGKDVHSHRSPEPNDLI